MKLERVIRQSMFVCCAALVAGVICVAQPAIAQGKNGAGGGGTGGGSIYYIDTGRETNYVWSMDSYGSGKTELGKWGYFAVPSRSLHNGFRWYLTVLSIPGSYYPDGTTVRFEVFAIRGDYDPVFNNNNETRVQLTDDPMLQPIFPWFRGAAWLPGDSKISFRARRWVGTAPAEGGLYTADFSYRADGNIIGMAAQPATLAHSSPLDSNGWPTLGYHSWDPAGTRVVYTDTASAGLWVANVSNNARTQIYSGAATYPDWSPDGTKIVFSVNSTITTIRPDGSGAKAILKPLYNWSAFSHPSYSATGSHITCVGWSPQLANDDVFRITSSGGSVTNLTNTANVNEIPIAWR